MSVALPGRAGRARGAAFEPSWALLILGFAAMYVPLYWWAAEGIWQTDEQGHGAIILVVVGWLFWTLRHQIDEAAVRPMALPGWMLFLSGIFVYFVGRVFDISILGFSSQPLVVTGALLLLRGPAAVHVAWFPLVYFIFMIPLPGILVDALTGSLKSVIANIVEAGLYAIGYPIARSGVILSIGQYQLQVADACSGLHSMFSLSALGTLFMYVTGRKSRVHLVVMLIAILPIAFVANIIRVVTLVLVTYYLGDEAGQGFLHGAAGMVLMMVALCALFVLDQILGKLAPLRAPAPLASAG